MALANAGDVLLPATERHDYLQGCRQHSDCHAPVARRPISVSSLAPDILAPWTIEAYRAGIDPAMAAVAEALRGDRSALAAPWVGAIPVPAASASAPARQPLN